MGGKYNIAKWIVDHFPRHYCYVEPFGGAAHVLLQKQISNVEIYNDINDDLVNLFLVARDQSEKIIEQLGSIPYSRALYDRWLKVWRGGFKPKDELDRAVWYFYLQNLSFAGKFGGGIQTSKVMNQVKSFYNKVENISRFANRFKKVVIEKLDYKELIKRYDSEKTLFYCDPPYVNLPYYGTKWGEDEHKELSDWLNCVEGKVVLSYYPNSILDDFYLKDNWYYDTLEVSMMASLGEHKTIKTELLICNFDFNKEPKFVDKTQSTLFENFSQQEEVAEPMCE